MSWRMSQLSPPQVETTVAETSQRQCSASCRYSVSCLVHQPVSRIVHSPSYCALARGHRACVPPSPNAAEKRL